MNPDQHFHSLLKPEEWPKHWREFALNPREVPASLKQGAIQALSATSLDEKIAATIVTARAWHCSSIGIGGGVKQSPPERPGRPNAPRLVPPNKLKKRSIRSQRGRIALLHAIAHIELNAMDLAWDIVARFIDPASKTHPRMPRSFYDGWVRVALEEAKHFSLLRERLQQLDAEYGDLEAHDGLWEAAQSTGHALSARLAVVPLILEARGLDVTPSLLRQMHEVEDDQSVRILEIIYRDEQGHVAVGAKWFRYLCLKENREPAAAFQKLVRDHFRGPLKPPFNDMARARAGLTPGFYRALSSAGT